MPLPTLQTKKSRCQRMNPRLVSSTYVRFLGQNYNLATFAIQTYSYPAGAAHGMSHQEFVNFDLSNKTHYCK